MQIPEEVLSRAKQILEKRKEHEDIKKRIEEAEAKRQAEINSLRKSRKEELDQYAQEVRQWVEQFLVIQESECIFSVLNPVQLFTAEFWQGAPLRVNSISEWASVSLKKESFYSGSLGVLIYEEHCKSSSHERVELYSTSNLVFFLHPDFLKQFAEALRNGIVWKKINQDLSRMIY